MSKVEFNRRKNQPVYHPAVRLPKSCLAAGLVLLSYALWPATGLAQIFTSTGTITFSSGIAASVPYPSLINVGTNGVVSLPGTIQAVTVTLQGLTCPAPADLSFMLVSPKGTPFEFMAFVGGTHSIDNDNITIADSASSVLPQTGQLTSGSFKPTSYYCGSGNTNQYPPPAPQPLSSTMGAPCGTGTFASVFSGSNPNGTWQLFAANRLLGPAASLSAWSLNFTINPPSLSVACTNFGNFCQGESGAQYFVTITNIGPGPTGGSVPAMVVDTFPTGLTPINATGAGWNFAISNQTVTCTATNQTAAGTSYPPITLMVNVAANATASLTNSVTLSGSSDGTHIANDVTMINPLNSAITPSPANPLPNSSGNQASAPAGASSYAWTIINGVITSAANLQTITYTAGSSGSVGLTLHISNASDCTAVDSVSVPLFDRAAQAQLIDVDFNTNSLTSSGGGPSLGPTMSGPAVLGQTSDQWNGINISSGTGIPLIYANGSNSPVTMTFASGGGYDVHSFSGTTPFAGTPYDALMEDYLYNAGVLRTITLSGLATNSIYNLVLYNAGDTAGAGRTTFFTVNNNTLSSKWDGASSTFIAGTDYVEFAPAFSDGSGNLAIAWTGNGTVEGDVNGFQIQVASVPQLGINLLAPGNAKIFWPGTGNFVLQTNKNLTSANWSNFNSSITTSNGTNSVTITPPTGNLFFRLKQ